MGEHEETHVEPTNEERQKKIKKCSHFLASPYTDEETHVEPTNEER